MTNGPCSFYGIARMSCGIQFAILCDLSCRHWLVRQTQLEQKHPRKRIFRRSFFLGRCRKQSDHFKQVFHGGIVTFVDLMVSVTMPTALDLTSVVISFRSSGKLL